MGKLIATGVENDSEHGEKASHVTDEKIAEYFEIPSPHLHLTTVTLRDQTDNANELVHEESWLLHPSEKEMSFSGNLFVVDDLVAGTGTIMVKSAPLPEERTVSSSRDLMVRPRKGSGFLFSLFEPSAIHSESWTVLAYSGGVMGRTATLHDWQRSQRPSTDGHTTLRLLSNTWGDRSRDACLSEEFMAAEIDGAHRLGVDVIQIDDGWQKGTTSNSASANERGGVWSGFWNTDPAFWEVNRERFPDGLRPLVARAEGYGIRVGLWFAPDSWNNYANWQKDADILVSLHSTYGIDHFKIDGILMTSPEAESNLHLLFAAVNERSRGEIVLDLDITAQVRPGYFGAISVGPLFVENRYTDWHNYWPHQTLRNLWKLSSWIDPRRLRMEFLNNTRNTHFYADDPLAPEHYSPDCLFATVMFSNPLGWFEISNLPDSYFRELPELIRTWKEHRSEIFNRTIVPIGQIPDGFSWTGFAAVSENRGSGYILLFRELNERETVAVTLPVPISRNSRWEILGGEGSVTAHETGIHATIPRQLGFVFARFMT